MAKEIQNYERLILNGVHTLIPLGYVISEQFPIPIKIKVGVSYENNEIAFTVNLLDNKAQILEIIQINLQ
jgi:hypothetical protein